MTHPYPPRWPSFDYKGKHYYALTFVTDSRRPAFHEPCAVTLVLAQILRVGSSHGFTAVAYCFMPDHLHLIVNGRTDDADCKAFIKAAKQYSGFYYKKACDRRLWERYGYDRVIRDERELALTVRYVAANPVRAGLVDHPRAYPYLGSEVYTVDELLAWCEYCSAEIG